MRHPLSAVLLALFLASPCGAGQTLRVPHRPLLPRWTPLHAGVLGGGAAKHRLVRRLRPSHTVSGTPGCPSAARRVFVSALASSPMHREVPMQIYIEHTDAFGVVFYANYLKFFERAIQDTTSGVPDKMIPSILRVDGLRYKNAAVLGQRIKVRSKVIQYTKKTLVEKFEIVNAENDEEIFTSAEVTWGFLDQHNEFSQSNVLDLPHEIAIAGIETGATCLDNEERPSVFKDEICYASFVDRVYVDDIDATGFLSPSSILRHFERARTMVIGGPDTGLERLRKEGINIYIARIDDLDMSLGLKSNPTAFRPKIGDRIEVRTHLDNFKPSTMVRMHQELWRIPRDDEGSATPIRIASGSIVAVVVSAESGKPIRGPTWLYEQIKSVETIHPSPSSSGLIQ